MTIQMSATLPNLPNFVHRVNEVDVSDTVKLAIFLHGVDSTDVADTARLAIFVHGVNKIQTQQHCPVSDVRMCDR
jgi:hypothetical protein